MRVMTLAEKEYIKSNLKNYKTAWSETYQTHVNLISFRLDDVGEPIISAMVPESDNIVLFRICELIQFSLE